MKEISYASEVALIGATTAINELIINDNFDEALDHTAKVLGISFDSDCIISQIIYDQDQIIDFTIEHFWFKIEDPDRISHIKSLGEDVISRMVDGLREKGVFYYKYSEADGTLRTFLDQPGGSQSGILLPILIDGQMWGVFSMTEMEYERAFSKMEIAVLKSLVTAIGSAVTKKLYQQRLEADLTDKTKQIIYRNTQLLSLIDNVPGIVFRCKNDDVWSMEYISKYVENITGYAASEFIADNGELNFNRIIHPSDLEVVKREIEEQLSHSRRYHITYRIYNKAGEIRWLWEQGIKKSGEEILEGCIMDITDKVAANEKLLSTALETEERERSRIAREIHDDLQQMLTTAHLNFQGIKKKMSVLDEKDLHKFETGFSFLHQAIDRSREIAHRLMPKTIEDYGFQIAVHSLIENLEGATSIKFSFMDNLGEIRLPIQIELTLFRITQEAVTNVIKFSKATEATIQLIKHAKSLILTIEDNGIGFDKQELNNFKSSFGINSMINRANSIGGQLYLDTSIGRGTQLTIEVPLTKTNNEQNQDSTGR